MQTRTDSPVAPCLSHYQKHQIIIYIYIYSCKWMELDLLALHRLRWQEKKTEDNQRESNYRLFLWFPSLVHDLNWVQLWRWDRYEAITLNPISSPPGRVLCISSVWNNIRLILCGNRNSSPRHSFRIAFSWSSLALLPPDFYTYPTFRCAKNNNNSNCWLNSINNKPIVRHYRSGKWITRVIVDENWRETYS